MVKAPAILEEGVDGDLLPRDALLQQVAGERGQAEEGLQDGVHIAGVPEVGESAGEADNRHVMS